VCAAGLAAAWFAANRDGRVRTLDLHVLEQLRVVLPRDDKATNDFVGLADPPRYALFVVAVLAIPALRRRWRLAAGVAVAVAGTSAAAEGLKHLVGPSPVAGLGVLQWPSGHAAAVAAWGCCLVLVAPARARLFTAVLAGAALGCVGPALVALGSHRPSDVVAGLLLGGAFAMLVPLLDAEREAPRRRPMGAAAAALGGVLALGLGSAVVRGALAGTVDYLASHAEAAGGIGVIVLVSVALVAASAALAP
jgi:hypothetical protein